MARTKPAKARGAWPVIRQLHIYLSVFVAPSLIFFALTGALQTFRVPDQKTAPVLLQKLARVHRDDVFAVKPPLKAPKRAEGGAVKPKPKPDPSTERLKWFFALTSVTIALTATLGLWMALVYSRRKRVVWVLLIAGAAAPVLILAI